MDVLEQKAKLLPFIKKGQEIHLLLFLKEFPTHCVKGMRVFLPSDVMKKDLMLFRDCLQDKVRPIIFLGYGYFVVRQKNPATI